MKRTLLTLALVAAAGTAGAQTMQTQGAGTVSPGTQTNSGTPMNSGTQMNTGTQTNSGTPMNSGAQMPSGTSANGSTGANTAPEMANAPRLTGAAGTAQKRIEADGYKNVTGLAQGADGLWHGTAMRGNTQVQVTVDRAGKVTKSLELPSFVRPAWADRRKYPVFARHFALALYRDGTWLVRPFEERSVMSTPEYDKKFSYAMRVDENGAIQRVVARFPRDEDMLDLSARKSRWTSRIPFHDRTFWEVSEDGSRIVATWRNRGADSATFQVAALGEKGDTIFSKKFPFTPVAIAKKSVDSALTKFNRSIADMSVEELRALVAKQIPPTYPPVLDLVPGRDNTTWVELRSTNADQHQWMALDATGAVIGLVALPKGFVLRAADRDHVWGYDSDVDRVKALVRYKIVASPPAKR